MNEYTLACIELNFVACNTTILGQLACFVFSVLIKFLARQQHSEGTVTLHRCILTAHNGRAGACSYSLFHKVVLFSKIKISR